MSKNKPVSGVYQITNIETEEFYIGATIDLELRRHQHYAALQNGRHENHLLQRSFDSTNGELEFAAFPTNDGPIGFKIEKELIKRNKGDPKCLNLRGGREYSGKKRVVSQEGRLKMSEARKRYYETHPSPRKGATMSEESRQKLRDAWTDPEYRANQVKRANERMQDPVFVVKHREAVIKAKSEMTAKQKREVREKITASCNEPAYLLALSARSNEMFSDPEFKKRHGRAVKEALADPEVRERISNGIKRTRVRKKAPTEMNNLTGV